MRNWLIRKLGGYAPPEHNALTKEFTDAKIEIEDLSDVSLKLQVKLREEKDKWTNKVVLNQAVKGLYNTIGIDDILREQDGKWMVGNKEINESIQNLLMAEAQTLIKMRLWKYLQADIKYGANRTMFIKARTEIHITTGKLWTWMLDTFKTRIESVARGDAKDIETDLS